MLVTAIASNVVMQKAPPNTRKIVDETLAEHVIELSPTPWGMVERCRCKERLFTYPEYYKHLADVLCAALEKGGVK